MGFMSVVSVCAHPYNACTCGCVCLHVCFHMYLFIYFQCIHVSLYNWRCIIYNTLNMSAVSTIQMKSMR